ncbi:uncharacterized protein [Macrobrachium rosenbergii]|uniref:uncharacterized protein n=1 Tax=Macrobrachium rosenbergii TaxID=79674 RepID=UPI0034D3DD47
MSYVTSSNSTSSVMSIHVLHDVLKFHVLRDVHPHPTGPHQLNLPKYRLREPNTMRTLKFYMQAGKDLEMSGQELQDWLQGNLDTAKAEREIERQEWEAQRIGMSALGQARSFMLKWTEAEPEVWLKCAERVLDCCTLSPTELSLVLTKFLGGKALIAYHALPVEDQGDWEVVCQAVTKAYEITPKRWRRRWRGQTRDVGQMWSDWAYHLERALAKWLESEGATSTAEVLEKFKLEHFLRYTPPALATHVEEKAPATLTECCSIADTWETHHLQDGSMGLKIYPPPFLGGSASPKNGNSGKTLTCGHCPQPPLTNLRGHPADSCTCPPDCRDCGKRGHYSSSYKLCPGCNQPKTVDTGWIGLESVMVTPSDGSSPPWKLENIVDTGSEVSIILCSEIGPGAVIGEDEWMMILWVNGDEKDLPTVRLRVTTSDISREREHLFGLAKILTTGKPRLLGQDLVQWRDPSIPLRCLKPSKHMGVPRPSRKSQEDLLSPGLSLGSIPWLQELPPASEKAETSPPSTTLLITRAAAALHSLAREKEVATSEDALTDLVRDTFLLEADLLYKVTRGPNELPQGRMKSKSGNTHCQTIIDHFIHYPEAIPVRSEGSKNAVKALVKFFCRFGFPATIQTDQGRHFMV